MNTITKLIQNLLTTSYVVLQWQPVEITTYTAHELCQHGLGIKSLANS